MDLHTVVSGVFHAMQEVAIPEILGLLRAQLAKITSCLRLHRGDGLVPNLGLLRQGNSRSLRHVRNVPHAQGVLEHFPPRSPAGRVADVGEKLERGAEGTLHNLLHMALACEPRPKWPRIAHPLSGRWLWNSTRTRDAGSKL